jgi:hypothetical protein
MNYFDYETLALGAGIPHDKLDQLAKLFAQEEPNDPMLAELHTLRACMAIKEGRLNIDQALGEARSLTTPMPNTVGAEG